MDRFSNDASRLICKYKRSDTSVLSGSVLLSSFGISRLSERGRERERALSTLQGIAYWPAGHPRHADTDQARFRAGKPKIRPAPPTG